jgi:heme exporter protein C
MIVGMLRRWSPWLLWLLLSAVIVGAFLDSTRPGEGFLGETGRILYFHVPNAWASFVAFVTAGAWSLLYLFGRRAPEHDGKAAAAVELGLLFCVLATVTGAIWARIQWGAYWNWDPRQTSITLALLFYAAYLALRGAVEDRETRSRLAAAYAALGLVVAPFLFFVLPRITYSLHPQPVVNVQGKIEMARPMLVVLLAGAAGFTALFFWLHDLRWRAEALRDRQRADS